MSEIQQSLVQETEELSEKLDTEIKNIEATLKNLRKSLSELKTMKKEIKGLEQRLKKSKKKKRTVNSENSKPSGFARPVPISKKLSEFLQANLIKVLQNPIEDEPEASPKTIEKNKVLRERYQDLLTKLQGFKKGSVDWTNVLARTDVTRLLTYFVKHYDLQDADHPKNILLSSAHGKKLEGLLSERKDKNGEDCELTFINMQRFIKHHFFKKK